MPRFRDARDGASEALSSSLGESVIEPLYGAYAALSKARARRHPLDIDLPERVIRLGPAGEVSSITPRLRFDSHRLIEEFMIQANVAAAESLNAAHAALTPCMYRVHETPDAEKVAALRTLLASLGYRLGRGQALKPAHFNQVLAQARDSSHHHLINAVILRCQAQAAYSPSNLGHFGLNLGRYAHFTSPIRRYADILVHRALISACRLGEGGLAAGEAEAFEAIGAEISAAERRAMAAERDTLNRFMSAYMHSRLGDSFAGRISGISRFGLFVSLDETGAEGIVPMRSLGRAAFRHDEAAHALGGQDWQPVLALGRPGRSETSRGRTDLGRTRLRADRGRRARSRRQGTAHRAIGDGTQTVSRRVTRTAGHRPARPWPRLDKASGRRHSAPDRRRGAK